MHFPFTNLFLTRHAAACFFTLHTPRVLHTPLRGVCLHFPHAAQWRVSSLRKRRTAACVFTSYTPRQFSHTSSGVSSLLTLRAAACAPLFLTRSGVCLPFSHAAQRRVCAACSCPLTRRTAACVCTLLSHAAQRGSQTGFQGSMCRPVNFSSRKLMPSIFRLGLCPHLSAQAAPSRCAGSGSALPHHCVQCALPQAVHDRICQGR
jgi:hypothetical protein